MSFINPTTQFEIEIQDRTSAIATIGGLIISIIRSDRDSTEILVTKPGLPPEKRVMTLGDSFLYETPDAGLINICAFKLSTYGPKLLLTLVNPKPGVSASLEPIDVENSKFSPEEIERIRRDVNSIRESMKSNQDLSTAQLDLLSRKLDDIISAADRLGRKDWVMFVGGNLTNICVAAAFSQSGALALIHQANTALGWIFQNTIRLIN